MAAFKSLIQNQAAAIAHARSTEAIATRSPLTPEELLQLPFKPGDRVLDRTTGQQGTVRAGTQKHSVIPQAASSETGAAVGFFELPKPATTTVITVQLDDGSYVDRDPAELVLLPAALNVPLASLAPRESL